LGFSRKFRVQRLEKSTPFAAQTAAEKAALEALSRYEEC
jgi:ribosomal protein S11